MSKSNLIFSEVNIFLSPLLKILKYFNFEVLYLDIKAQSKLKSDELAINLKKFGIIPLSLENEKEISENAFAIYDSDIYEQTYKTNLKLLNDVQLERLSKIFNIKSKITKALRLTLQDSIYQRFQNVALVQLWSNIYKKKKIFFITFSHLFFVKAEVQNNNLYCIYIPIYLLKNIIQSINLFVISLLKIFIIPIKIFKTSKKKKRTNNFKDAKVMYVVHKGLSYGKLFEKELYYSDDENSLLHKNNILHLDYSNHISSNSNLKWYSTGTTSKIDIKSFIKLLLKFFGNLSLIRNKENFLGLLLIINRYRNFLFFTEILKKFKNIKCAIIDYDILCPKALILSLKSLNIETYAAQERFIYFSCKSFANVLVDNYFAASTYSLDMLKKSKFNDIKKIFPYGQYRSDYLDTFKKTDLPEEIFTAKKENKKIITALGYHCSDTWYESNTTSSTSWTSNKSFIEDMLRISKNLNEIFIVLRYKNLEWTKLSFFNDLLEQIKKNSNITISNNYNKSFYTYKLCANSDLIIAKHTSVVDECLSKKIPVLIHDYVHNSNNIFAMAFDYGGSEIVCHNYDELLNRSKIFLENKNNETTKKIEKLHKEFYQTEQYGLVRDKIFNHLNKNLN